MAYYNIWDTELLKSYKLETALFNGISTFMGYLMPKPSLLKNSNDNIEAIVGLV